MKLFPILVALLIFVLPMNLFVQLHTSSSFVHGLQVDYLIPKLYVSDLVIIALLALQLIKVVKTRQKIHISLVGAMLIAAFAARQFFSENSIASVFFLIKILELSALCFILWQRREDWQKSSLAHWALLAAMLFQSLVGLGQFWQQTSVFPSYLFFGESRLLNPIGLTKASFGAAEKILPYGTTPHPNILAGFLVVGIVLLLQNIRQKKPSSQAVTTAVILLSLFTIFLTQSWSAWLSLGIGVVMIIRLPISFFSKNTHRMLVFTLFTLLIMIPFFINFLAFLNPGNSSFTRREMLQLAAVRMFVSNPITGVGLNNFTVKLEDYANSREVVRFVQPVHNVGWLWLSETGLLGVVVVGWIFLKLKKIHTLVIFLILLPILALDHYLFSTQIGMLMVVLFFTKF